MLHDLSLLLLRDLDTLSREVELYPDDGSVWREVAGLPNSGGTLVLHLVGNLRHFIGATLGHTGFVRDRSAEFAARGLSRHELSEAIAVAHADVEATLRDLPEAALETAFPQPIGGLTFTTRLALLHLATHLSYHLGQLDYHRRAVTGDSASAGAMAVTPFAAATHGRS